ncbi:hypothetical protein M9H77_19184 [Catharanthus roseus]|uniref:Uncharacterized protein n=1 Tax=Catharanthus roseus TaxID=4058 RepID=A0ACC0B9K0_CATRO|nr:hypothetical protein M9H77_19184 [Catharanthus roseus]
MGFADDKGDEWLTLKLHHGGYFTIDDRERKNYEGGEIDYVDNCSIDMIEEEELMEEFMKELMPSLPKSSGVIEEIENENAQPVVTAGLMGLIYKLLGLMEVVMYKLLGLIEVLGLMKYDIEFERQESARKGNVQQSSRAYAAESSTPVEELHKGIENVNVQQISRATTITENDGLKESFEFDDSSNEDYMVDQFIDDDEYCMDDYVVEEEVQVEHKVGNEINTECEPSAATSKKRGKRKRQEEY